MNRNNLLALTIGALTAYGACASLVGAQAQPSPVDHAAHHPTAASAAAPVPMADGEVRRVDVAQAKITLKHGFIENLGMPGMTMVFKVADPKLLDGIKPGDKVRFAAQILGGALLVTAIEPAR